MQWQRPDTFHTARHSHGEDVARSAVIAAVGDRHISRLMQAFNHWEAKGSRDPADRARMDAVKMLSAWQELVEYCFARGARLDIPASEFCERPAAASSLFCGPRLLDVVDGWNFSKLDASYLFLSQLACHYRQSLEALSDATRRVCVRELQTLLGAWSFDREEDRRFSDAQQDLDRWSSQYADICAALAEAVAARDLPRVQAYLRRWTFDRESDANVRDAVEFVKQYRECRRELQMSVKRADLVSVRSGLRAWIYGEADEAYRRALHFDESWGKHYEASVKTALSQAVSTRHVPNLRKHVKQWIFAEDDETYRSALAFEEAHGPLYDRLCGELEVAVAVGAVPKAERHALIRGVLTSWVFSREDGVYVRARNLLSGLQLLQWVRMAADGGGGLRVVCLLDQSTSIGDHEFDHEVKPAVRELARGLGEVAGAGAEVLWRLAVFPGQSPGGGRCDCQDICGDWMPLGAAMLRLDDFEYQGGSTPMHGGLRVARELLEDLPEPSGVSELVVLFTDGEPDDKELAMAASRRLASRTSLMMHGVGIGDGISMQHLEQITDEQCTKMEMHGLPRSLAQWMSTSIQIARRPSVL